MVLTNPFDLSSNSIQTFAIETLVFGEKVYNATSEKRKAIKRLKKSIPTLGNTPCVMAENDPPINEAMPPIETLPFCLILTPLWRKKPIPIPRKVHERRLITNEIK